MELDERRQSFRTVFGEVCYIARDPAPNWLRTALCDFTIIWSMDEIIIDSSHPLTGLSTSNKTLKASVDRRSLPCNSLRCPELSSRLSLSHPALYDVLREPVGFHRVQ